MFEAFSEGARKVMALANQEAQRRDSEWILSEHILIGIIRQDAGVGARVLKSLGVDRSAVSIECGDLASQHEETAGSGKLPQAQGTKRVIELAIEEALDLDYTYCGTEHLLLGLLRFAEGDAARVLAKLGVTLERARAEIQRLGASENK